MGSEAIDERASAFHRHPHLFRARGRWFDSVGGDQSLIIEPDTNVKIAGGDCMVALQRLDPSVPRVAPSDDAEGMFEHATGPASGPCR